MMGPFRLAAALTVLLSLASGGDSAGDRLWARVHTADGEVVEGWLRWNGSEVGRSDFMDIRREIPEEHLREAERLDPDFAARQRAARSLVAFGVRLTWEVDDQAPPPSVRSLLRFGYVRALAVDDDGGGSVWLTSGEEIPLVSSTGEVGRTPRSVTVQPPGGEERTVRWREIERVEFVAPPSAAEPPEGTRLHGTLTTWSGLEFTGDIVWDRDETLSTDVLDGRSDGEDLEIAFGGIARIEYESPREARVVLRSGEALELRGTNDVDRGNRGIEVSDPGLGRVTAGWEDFRTLALHPAAGEPAWPDFSPGAIIRGTVYAVDGRVLEGSVRWGNERTWLWESLDGWVEGTRFEIAFGSIRSIRKVGDDGAEVTLADGRVFVLEDVHPEERLHRGVFVTPEGRATRLVRWEDFERLELTR